MELKNFITPLLKWWWLLVLATLVAGVSSFMVVRQQPLEYEASTTLMIGRTISDLNPSGNEFFLSQQLADVYADIAQRDPVRKATMTALGIGNLPKYVARALPNTQFIEIAVTDTDPERAQAVANELANQLILQSPAGSQQEELERQVFVNEQLDYLETKIEETKDDITTKQEELAEMVSARQIADTHIAITALQGKLTTLQGNYASLLASTQRGAINTISVIELASLPGKPVGPDVTLTVVLAAAVGFVLAAGGAYLIEYLDDTLKTPAEVSRLLEVPVLGHIAETKELKMEGRGIELLMEEPLSPLTESFRALGTNLDLAAEEKALRTLLVVSPGAKEGKTTVAINLAATMARGGKRVVLIDADLRKPQVHQILGIPNQVGLCDLIQKDMNIVDVAFTWKGKRLAVVPSGNLPQDPVDVLGSLKMVQIFSEMRSVADVIVIDSSPVLLSDTWLLTRRVDWVLMVLTSGRTRAGAAQDALDQLKRTNARVVGVVLNRMPPSQAYAYGRNQYYSSINRISNDGKFAKQKPSGRKRDMPLRRR